MDTVDSAGLVYWRTAPKGVLSDVQTCLSEIVRANLDELVAAFYDAFLQHESGRAFLDHTIVHERLSKSMAGWLCRLVEVDLTANAGKFLDDQRKIGEIHARLGVPNHLVLQGASLLKSRIAGHLIEARLDRELMAASLIILGEIIDYAMCAMSEAYVSHTRDRAKADEAFRHLALGQDIMLERETQRATLMEWSHSILFGLLGSQDRNEFRKLGSSAFGLWIRHRAGVMFHGSPILASIEQLIQSIDDHHLPAVVESHPKSMDQLAELQERIEELKFLLNDLLQSAAAVENGRDPLTRALNRRFLPSVMGREIALAKANNTPLSVALVDVDHFKRINDQFGHSGGDLALAHVADALLNAVRSSDFVFRYGGEEFLIVFAETTRDEAARIAERICRQFENDTIPVPQGGEVKLTVSIGIAGFDGHPDHEFLIDAADRALYEAKHQGRNRVITLERQKAA